MNSLIKFLVCEQLYSNDLMWLTECLEGKYKALEKAAKIYQVSMEQPMYFRLVILELMENLTGGDFTVRRNSLWMLSKLVEEHRDYRFISPTIQILISSLDDKNQSIRYFTVKIINEIVGAYYDQFKQAIPRIVNNIKDSSSKIKLFTAAIITQFMEIDPNAMESAIKLLVQALKENDLEVRELAIKALLRINLHVDKVIESIMELFHEESFRIDMMSHIFDFIKQNPEDAIEALKKTIKNKDDKVRENSIVFLHQIAETKFASDLVKVVPELLTAITDKNKIVHRTAARILFLISKENAQSLLRGIPKFKQFLKIKNKQLVSFFIYILVQLMKYFSDELSDQVDPLKKLLEKSQDWEDADSEVEIINAISLCTLIRYENQIAESLNIAQSCVKNHPFEKGIHELELFIGYTHYYLEDYSDAIQAFLKAETAYKREDYYTATIANIMVAFNFALLRTFKSSLDYKKDAEKYFELAKDRVSTHKIQKIQFLMDFINAIATHDFTKAQNTLLSYHALDPVKHPFERKLQILDLNNVKKVNKFYLETQKILEEMKKNGSNQEPSLLKEEKT